MAEKVYEQLQQMQEDLAEQGKLERETARECTNEHRRQLDKQTHQFQQALGEANKLRGEQLQERQQELTTQQAKMKEERKRDDADTQKRTQEHQGRVAATNQEHEKHVERRYQEDDKAAQEATQGREELRNAAKEYNDGASADHARNVEAHKDGLTHMRQQQGEQVQRKIENINQQKIEYMGEQTKTEQNIKAVTAESRATLIETLRFKIKSSMALIDAANKATKIDSHITTYDNTLARCMTTGLTSIRESDRVKLQLSILILELEASSEACNNPTAADSKDGTSNQPLNEIEEIRNLVKNYCEQTESSLDELRSICSNSISSLSTNPNLSEELRRTYKSHLRQVNNEARNLYGAVYKTKSNMDSRFLLKITNLEKLDKELKDGINKLNKELDDIPEAQGIDELREQLEVLKEIMEDSTDRLAKIRQQEPKKLDTSSPANAIQNGDE